MTTCPNWPAVSVALCTYNGARFIEQQIASICRQDLLPMEIVLSDDASSDACVALAERAFLAWKSDHPCAVLRLRVLRRAAPLGVTGNFEAAVSACQGELIALCDQDDVWHSDRLRRMVEQFAAQPGLLFLHANAWLIDDQGRRLSGSLFDALQVRAFELDWIREGRAIDVFLRRNIAAGTTVLFRRRLLEHASPFPPEWLHDEWLAAVAAALGGVGVLDAALTDYRQHANNQIGATRAGMWKQWFRIYGGRASHLRLRALKASILLKRLQSLGAAVPAQVVQSVQEKLHHQQFRAALPASRHLRLQPVMAELRAGRYHRFGRAAYSVAWDLLGPA